MLASEYAPHEKQAQAHRCDARFMCMAAGVRGGKTKSGSVEFLRRAYKDVALGKGRKTSGQGRRRMPRLRYWVVGPTMPLTKYPYEYIVQFTPPELVEMISQTDYSIWLRPDIQIEFKTAERPDLLVGADVDGMLLTEACRIKAEAWRGSLRARLTSTKGWCIFETSPLGGLNSWVYKEIVSLASVDNGVQRAGGDPDFASFSWRTVDNPYIDPVEVERARQQLPRSWFLRDYEASWSSFGGQIYDEFNPALHLVKESQFRLEYGLGERLPRTWNLFRNIVCGVDFGYTAPGAMVVVGELGDGRYVILEESFAAARAILGSGTTWLSEARRLRDRWGVRMFVCDPARPDAINDLAVNGAPTVGAFNDVYLGIRRVAEALHPVEYRPGSGVRQPGLRIFDSCTNLSAELRSYQWKSNRDQTGFAEVPAEGQSDHACDALRYALVELKPFAFGHGQPQQQVRR